MLASEVKLITEDSLDDFSPDRLRIYNKEDREWRDSVIHFLNTLIVPRCSRSLMRKIPGLKSVRIDNLGAKYSDDKCKFQIIFDKGFPIDENGNKLSERAICEKYLQLMRETMFKKNLMSQTFCVPDLLLPFVNNDGQLAINVSYQILPQSSARK